MSDAFAFGGCPAPLPFGEECVLLAHGEGARLARQLIERRILPRLRPALLEADDLPDAAQLPEAPGPLAFTTDSFVVSPLFFPGGDIGRLAVFGTVNDLAVSGAAPLWLSLALILEEGLPLATLDRALASVAAAAQEAGVRVATGDTKVVPRGAADGLFLNVSGIGRALPARPPGPKSIATGDALIVTGPIGRHGLAILAAREELDLQPPIESDCGSLWPLVSGLQEERLLPHVRAMRDATRGGVAAVLHEWAAACGLTLCAEEARIPITPAVRGASELLGLDPLYIANEGTMLLAVEAAQAEAVVAALRTRPGGERSTIIGAAQPRLLAPVVAIGATGVPRPVDDVAGTLLPRIC